MLTPEKLIELRGILSSVDAAFSHGATVHQAEEITRLENALDVDTIRDLLDGYAPDAQELRAQVTSLQEHNTKEVKRRRKLEAKLALQERLGGLCIRAIGKWGEEPQLAMCAEECAELGAEILRVLRGRKAHLMPMIEEGADVYITVMQLRLQNPVFFDRMVSEKLDRLEKLLEASA